MATATSIQPCNAETHTKFKTLRAMQISVKKCTREGLDAAHRDALDCFAFHANQHGYCYPSNETVLEWCSSGGRPVSERTLHKKVKELTAWGLIERTGKGVISIF